MQLKNAYETASEIYKSRVINNSSNIIYTLGEKLWTEHKK